MTNTDTTTTLIETTALTEPQPEEAVTTGETDVAMETTEHLPIGQQLAVLGFMLLLMFGSGIITTAMSFLKTETSPAPEEVLAAPAAVTIPDDTEHADDPFTELSITATSAFVWDVQAQRALYQKNPDEQLPLASITKLMTALIAHELVTDQTIIPITSTAIEQEGDSGFRDGESFSLSSLLDLILLSSSNDGAFAIATAIGSELAPGGDAAAFVEAMNIRATDLGLTQTYFRNPTGLDISPTESGAYSSARDITFLTEYILTQYPEIIAATKSSVALISSDAGLQHTIENTNPMVDELQGLIGSKTGYTDLAGGNLVVAFDAALNRPIIIVVLGSTRSGRFEDVLSLADRARLAIQ